MSYSCIASPEFTNLCQSQITLLNKGLNAVWTAVYLTEAIDEDWQTNLVPVAIYPRQDCGMFPELPPIRLSELQQQLTGDSSSLLLPKASLAGNSPTTTSSSGEKQLAEKRRLILPLIYEDTVMGLLVTGRKDRDWQSEELKQVKAIAQTLAIARFVELKYEWSQEQLISEQNLRHIERDRLDDLLHQLRNPLTAIRTFSKLLIKRLLPEDRNYSVAKSILAQSDRFSELLQQFEAGNNEQQSNSLPVTLSTTSVPLLAESSRQKSNFLLPESDKISQSIAIEKVLEPILITAKAIAEEKKIDLQAKIPQDTTCIKANSKALREVLNNLIDNALKYTPAGGKVEIAIEIDTISLLVGIAIKDTGYGIDGGDRDRIFERHYRGIQAEGDIPGSGLGLAIAKELVEQMQGKIELISPNNLAEDSDAPGTTFIVWLPQAEDVI